MLSTDHQRSAFQLGLGVASPLWPAFAVAASAGAAYWWMSRWTFGQWRSEFVNLEAVLAPKPEAPVEVAPALEQPVEVLVEAVVAAEPVEATPPVAAQAPAEPVAETPAPKAKPAPKFTPTVSAKPARAVQAKSARKKAPAKTKR